MVEHQHECRDDDLVDRHGAGRRHRCEYDAYVVSYSAPVEVQAQCAVVSNFRRTGASTAGDGTLTVNYAWDSSDGNLSHLTTCQVWERVAYPGPGPYYDWPYPMLETSPNPTDTFPTAVPGPDGIAVDHHYPPSSFGSPLEETEFTATQGYFYNCTCQDGTIHGLPGNPHSIFRYVWQRNIWLYGIVKDPDSYEIPLIQLSPSLKLGRPYRFGRPAR